MSALTLGVGSLFVFLAAIVRGYSGFGFSLLVITALSLLHGARDLHPVDLHARDRRQHSSAARHLEGYPLALAQRP